MQRSAVSWTYLFLVRGIWPSFLSRQPTYLQSGGSSMKPSARLAKFPPPVAENRFPHAASPHFLHCPAPGASRLQGECLTLLPTTNTDDFRCFSTRTRRPDAHFSKHIKRQFKDLVVGGVHHGGSDALNAKPACETPLRPSAPSAAHLSEPETRRHLHFPSSP